MEISEIEYLHLDTILNNVQLINAIFQDHHHRFLKRELVILKKESNLPNICPANV
jgi:hypothetical protein